jgi:hypothetical protein
MSSHAVNAFGCDRSALFKSAGTWCTTPPEIFFCDTDELTGFRTSARPGGLAGIATFDLDGGQGRNRTTDPRIFSSVSKTNYIAQMITKTCAYRPLHGTE